MNLIQIVLIAFVLLSAYVYLTRLRSQLLDRLLILLLVLSALVLIATPSLSNRLANLFGVGRGADFIFYLTHAGMVLVVVLLYSRLRVQSEQIGQLTRQIAVAQAIAPPGDPIRASSDHLYDFDPDPEPENGFPPRVEGENS